jgi:hypothetical protein
LLHLASVCRQQETPARLPVAHRARPAEVHPERPADAGHRGARSDLVPAVALKALQRAAELPLVAELLQARPQVAALPAQHSAARRRAELRQAESLPLAVVAAPPASREAGEPSA